MLLKLLYCLLFFVSVNNVSAESGMANLPEMLTRIKPAVVAVGTFMPTRNPRAVFLGTGFAIADGSYVVTNAHVTAKDLDTAHLERFAVFFRQDQQERMMQADLLVADEEHDLALLKLSGGNLPALQIGDSRQVKEGELYAFTGYPIGMILGLYPVTHRSIISAISPNAIPVIASKQLNVKMLKRLATPYDVFQLDATAYPGNSGSPLYDIETGKVVGIINKVFVQSSKENAISHPSGISYAIPSVHIKQLLVQEGIK